ncbi:hypothetical protein FHG87_003478 [Trinorchestia longiramus]|nr:hypothetical protein FHG87_003478 [Trinorchestia longiramus]
MTSCPEGAEEVTVVLEERAPRRSGAWSSQEIAPMTQSCQTRLCETGGRPIHSFIPPLPLDHISRPQGSQFVASSLGHITCSHHHISSPLPPPHHLSPPPHHLPPPPHHQSPPPHQLPPPPHHLPPLPHHLPPPPHHLPPASYYHTPGLLIIEHA